MNKWVCDNCGKAVVEGYFIEDENQQEVFYWQVFTRRKEPGSNSKIGSFVCDLCDECKTKLVKILKDGF